MEDKRTEISILDESIRFIKIAIYPLSLFIIVIVLSIKLYQLDLSVLIGNLQFSDLLSILLAFFSIGISIAFYFKANDTSNKFYDNTYKFTQNTSEILGRIESGFGERLRSINESYDKLDNNIRSYYGSKEKAKKEEIEKSIKNEEDEKERIISKLIDNSKLGTDELEELRKKLDESNQKLEEARNEIIILRRNSRRNNSDIEERVERYYRAFIRRVARRNNYDISVDEINQILKEDIEHKNIPYAFIRDMERVRLLDNENNLTLRGYRLTRNILDSLSNSDN
ncbi:hypothetical protein [Mannheimia varigena]|uniref:hypothetical protein n=1 Tax=Mannheimia varigena TaxID=85404 RepID=UPI0003E32A28|nr:hypothetical protein [Mannheimia varigena]AHG78525.1 hypothetical protein X874_18920 [Mannheimia varigena USDA-ARS-USMARC-1312]QLB17139.1 hypothetical protein A6B40_05875 [Mannheimia varigena]